MNSAKLMNSKFKWILGSLGGVVLFYRLVFSDVIISNFETPPGYTPPKSIAQIEAAEQKAFEKALAEVSAKDIASVSEIKPIPTAPLKITQSGKKTVSFKVKKLTRQAGFKKINKFIKSRSKQTKRVATKLDRKQKPGQKA